MSLGCSKPGQSPSALQVRTLLGALHVTLLMGLGPLSAVAGDWPRWRGPNRDGHAAPGNTGLTALPNEPKTVWRLSVGPGFSSPIVAGSRVIYLDAQQDQEVVHACEAETGRELWNLPIAASVGDEWGSGPRSTPFADGDRLYAQSCDGHFVCLDLTTGQVRWRVNFEDFGVKFLGGKAREGTASRRGNNGCGLVEGEGVYVPVGSTNGATIVGFEKRTGRELWRALNDEAAYSSLVVGTFGGVRQLVAFTADALAGLDLKTGAVLWRVPLRTDAKRHAATPVIVGETVVVNSQTLGTVCFRISRAGAGWQAARAWLNAPLKINLSTPVLVGGHLYCLGVKRDYVCLDAGTGTVQWSQLGFGKGDPKDYAATLAVGESLLVVTEGGELVLLAASPAASRELGRVQVCGSTWCHPALAGSRLYVRDRRQLLCLDLAGR